MAVGVPVGVRVGIMVQVGVAVLVGTTVSVGVLVRVPEHVRVTVGVRVAVLVRKRVMVGVEENVGEQVRVCGGRSWSQPSTYIQAQKFAHFRTFEALAMGGVAPFNHPTCVKLLHSFKSGTPTTVPPPTRRLA